MFLLANLHPLLPLTLLLGCKFPLAHDMFGAEPSLCPLNSTAVVPIAICDGPE